MQLIPTPYQSTDWVAVSRFLETATHPVDDLLLWADVASSLGRMSRIWRAEEEGDVVALAYAFPIWEALSAFGLRGLSPAHEQAVLEAAAREAWLPEGFVICDPAQFPLYEATGRVTGHFREGHLTMPASAWQSVPTPGVRPATLPEVDAFYRRHGAGAWNPVQFETGPFVVAEVDGEVVAAAGTHFRYAELAQLGNVLTAPAHRGRGLARRVTAAVCEALVAMGTPTISLFVAEDNAPAWRVYESLGFTNRRMLDTFRWLPAS